MNLHDQIFRAERLALVFSGAYAINLIRYLLLAGSAFLVLYIWRKRFVWLPKIQGENTAVADWGVSFCGASRASAFLR